MVVRRIKDSLYCIVVYDVVIDRIRTKISEKCLDYGLERIQYSTFCGYLSRNRTEELFMKLKSLLNKEEGRLLVVNLCKTDEKRILLFDSLI